MRLLVTGWLVTFAAVAQAQTQNLVISGKVLTVAGAPIVNANVYINDLALTTRTSAAGTYTLTIPIPEGRFGVNLRVRALGYIPQVRAIRVIAEQNRIRFFDGSDRMDFLMEDDKGSRDSMPVPARQAERLPFSASRPASQTLAVPGQADPFGRFLFTPEQVMQHQGALGLQDAQRVALQNAIQEAQTQVLKMQWALSSEGEKLTQLLSAQTLNEKEVLDQVDRVMVTEREIKRAQMTLLLRIRNTLSPQQQAKLRELRDRE